MTTNFTITTVDETELKEMAAETQTETVTVQARQLHVGDVLDSGEELLTVQGVKLGTKYVTVDYGVRTVKMDLAENGDVQRQAPTPLAQEARQVLGVLRAAEKAKEAKEAAQRKLGDNPDASTLAWYAKDAMQAEHYADLWATVQQRVETRQSARPVLDVFADMVRLVVRRLLQWEPSQSTSTGHNMDDVATHAAHREFLRSTTWIVPFALDLTLLGDDPTVIIW